MSKIFRYLELTNQITVFRVAIIDLIKDRRLIIIITCLCELHDRPTFVKWHLILSRRTDNEIVKLL